MLRKGYPLNEANPANKKFQKELNAGTAALVLLSVMNHTAEPMYGYQIARHIESISPGVSMMKQGALYPVLRSLEKSGLLESSVEPSISGPPRRYYHITVEGRRTLGQWREMWNVNKLFIDSVLKGTDDA